MADTAFVTYHITTTGTSSYPPADGYRNAIPHSDNFNSPSGLNTFYWKNFQFIQPNTAVNVSDSQLQLSLGAGQVTFCGIFPALQTRLLGSSVSCELATVGNADTSGSGTFLALQVMTASVDEYGLPTQPFGTVPNPTQVPNLRIACHEGNLLCTFNNMGGSVDHDNTIASITYDPVAHKYVQISDAMVDDVETAVFSVSPDGTTWTEVASTATVGSCAGSLELANVCVFAYALTAQSSTQTFGVTNYVYTGAPVASPPLAVASASVVILTPENDFVASTGSGLPAQVNVVLNPGDTVPLIRENLVSAVRMAAGDPSLDVVFHGVTG